MFWKTIGRVFDSEVNMLMSCMKKLNIYISMFVTELQNGMSIPFTIYNLPFWQFSFSCLSYHPEWDELATLVLFMIILRCVLFYQLFIDMFSK